MPHGQLPRPATAGRRRAVGLVLTVLVWGGCGGGDRGTDEPAAPGAALPSTCAGPPLTVRLEALTPPPAGSTSFRATDAAARRVPILPGEGVAADAAAMARQQERASATELAFYTLYLADFPIEREELTGPGLGLITPSPGGTVGALTVVPARASGFQVGDVVTGSTTPEYEAVSTLAPLTLTVTSDQHTTPDAYTDVIGQVTVVHLTDDVICLDAAVEWHRGGSPVVAVEGVVAAPVHRSASSFYLR